MQREKQIKVWDFFVRFFHWSLVTAFTIAFVTEGDFLQVHAWAGYLILGLLALRFIWGVIGSQSARFSDFVYSFSTVKHFLLDTMQLKAKRYLGHNPAGGWMVLALFISLLITATTGYALVHSSYGEIFLMPINLGLVEEVHEFAANFTLFLVVVHIVGVIVESIIHQESLLMAMLSGYKKIEKQVSQ